MSAVPRPTRRLNPRVRIGLILVLLALIAVVAYPAVGYLRGSWHWRKAQTAIAARDFRSARDHLDACLRTWPESAETAFIAARTARRAGDFPAAARLLADARRLGWVQQQVVLEDALLQIQNGTDFSGIEFLRLCVRKDHPDSILIFEVLTPAALRAIDFALATECLDLWVKLEPTNPQPHIDRGDLKLRLRFKNDALEEFKLAVGYAPDNSDARLRLGRLLVEMNRPEEAATHYEFLVEHRLNDPKARLGLARCRYEVGRNDDATQILEELLHDQPKNGAALYLRGQIELNSGRPADAERWFRAALSQTPYEVEVLYNLERSLNVQGKTSEAEEVKKRRLVAESDQKDVAKLMREIDKNPADPEPRRQMAIRLMRNGMAAAAKHWLEVALQHNPRHAPTHETMADYYEKIGDLPAAARWRASAKVLTAEPK